MKINPSEAPNTAIFSLFFVTVCTKHHHSRTEFLKLTKRDSPRPTKLRLRTLVNNLSHLIIFFTSHPDIKRSTLKS